MPSPRRPRGTPCRTAHGTAAQDSPSRPDTASAAALALCLGWSQPFLGHSPALHSIRRAHQVRPLPSTRVLLHGPHRYYGPLRLPLRSHPFRRYAAYRARRSQATRELAPHGSLCWGGDGSLLFPRWLCQRSTPSTPLGSSGLLLQVLHPFPGLRPGRRDSAPSCSLAGSSRTTRQASLHAADRWLAPSQIGGLDPALRRPGLPKRRRATTKVT